MDKIPKDRQTERTLYDDLESRVWRFLNSLHLTIGLMITLACVSILGTVIDQGGSPDAYVREYGEGVYKLFAFLGITNMFILR